MYNDRDLEIYFKVYEISRIKEFPGALPHRPPSGLLLGPTGGLKAAPRLPASGSVASSLTSIPGSASDTIDSHI
jgi:hypothetical protein